MEHVPPPPPRHQAPGGWRRAVVGVLCGATLGLWLTRLMPRDEDIQRRWWRGDQDDPPSCAGSGA